MSFIPETKKQIKKSPIYNRLHLTNNEEFTIPETASLFCSGGGIFRNGLAIGNNNSIIPGSIRYNDNKIQYLKNEGWINVTGFFNNNSRENSIVKFGNDGELTDTNILIENNDIIGTETIETEYITPPDGKDLNINNLFINHNGTISNNGKISLKNENNSKKVSFSVGVPENSNSPGEEGDIAFSENYIYICIDTNKWKRVKIESW